MQFVSALRNTMSPDSVLQDAVSLLEEALSLLDSQTGRFPPAILQAHQATYNRLKDEAQELSINNSLEEAKALRKEAKEFKDEVRKQCDSLRREALN